EPFGVWSGRGDPFAAAIRSTPMPMIITDIHMADHPMVFVNEAFETMSGYNRDELIGRDCRFLQGPDTDPDAVRQIHEAIVGQRAIKIDLLNYRKDGSSFWNALHISPVWGDTGNAEFFVGSMMEVTHRVEAQQRIAEQKSLVEAEVKARTADLERALEAKTVLAHEVDHRVKNNLTMIGSLLRLQSRSLPDAGLRRSLEDMLERIDALASINRQLYGSDDITRFDVGGLAAKLASDLLSAAELQDVQLAIDVDPVVITASKATAIGLILNELLIGTVRRIQAGGQLALGVHHQNGQARIEIRAKASDLEPAAPVLDAFSLTLVERMSRQIKATIQRDETSGIAISLCFPIDS
ncbi:MAG: PAS domain-containing protein, partial [Janthinobacterium lividum]